VEKCAEDWEDDAKVCTEVGHSGFFKDEWNYPLLLNKHEAGYVAIDKKR
jgi:hypothetical protein